VGQGSAWLTIRATLLLNHQPPALFRHSTAAASAASLSGASTKPRNSPRFLMSDTAQVRSFFAIFFAMAQNCSAHPVLGPAETRTSAPLYAGQALSRRSFFLIRPGALFIVMPDPTLILRRANVSRISGQWQDEDYDVFDGDREVGRIYLIDSQASSWFWGVSFQVTKRKSFGYALSLEDAKAAFRAEYEAWKGTGKGGTG
jgi:hypothetical protein